MLAEATDTANALRRALEREVERARGDRDRLRSLDAGGLFASAAGRAAFNAEVARLEGALADALARDARSLGIAEVTLARLASRAPAESAALSRALADVRTLTDALREVDRLNAIVAGRALACVRSHLAALVPAPSAYDRRGARAGADLIRPALSSKV
ncbi:MAG TPA: flagellar export chaperone FlgN [Anaeromyxobacteraceae bacterium]|nr:flagellar export chaperone FlgN [Anaeromyxobacteraceae bacterium]